MACSWSFHGVLILCLNKFLFKPNQIFYLVLQCLLPTNAEIGTVDTVPVTKRSQKWACVPFCLTARRALITCGNQQFSMILRSAPDWLAWSGPFPSSCGPKHGPMDLYLQVHGQSAGRSSGAVWKSRWPFWVPVPNKPTVSVDVKQHPAKTQPKQNKQTDNNKNKKAQDRVHGLVQMTTLYGIGKW